MDDASGADEMTLDFDPDALRERYREERDKRVRVDANAQYIEVKGDFAHFIDDHYIEAPVHPRPADRRGRRGVIGGGFGGLLVGARLREAGVSDIRIIEKGGDFGGTWYWNRYPGAQCDIESYIYLPLLEETGYIPKEKYSFAAGDLRALAAHRRAFRPLRDACFQTKISRAALAEEEKRWLVTTNRDDAMQARFVVMSNGPLNRPKLPAIPGIETLQGPHFHTSRWDYDYTGGGCGGLDKLSDKRVRSSAPAPRRSSPSRTWARAPAALRLPAHPLVGRPARQQAHRPGLGQPPGAGLAAGGRRTSTTWSSGCRSKRTWSTTAGPTSSATSAAPPRRGGAPT